MPSSRRLAIDDEQDDVGRLEGHPDLRLHVPLELLLVDEAEAAVRVEEDNDADGTPDSITHYTHDANGNQTSYQRDEGADGTVDYAYYYFFDANGNQTRYEYDNDGDGTPDIIQTSVVLGSGILVRVIADTDEYANATAGVKETMT